MLNCITVHCNEANCCIARFHVLHYNFPFYIFIHYSVSGNENTNLCLKIVFYFIPVFQSAVKLMELKLKKRLLLPSVVKETYYETR